jgi:hypothetical protein
VPYLDQVLEQAQAIGGEVAEAVEPVRRWRARANALNAELDGVREQYERTRTELITDLARGAVDLPGTAQMVAGLEAWMYDSPASKVVVAAVAQAHQHAGTALQVAAQPTFEALQALCAAAVQESVKLHAGLPQGVTTIEAAVAAGEDGPARWRRLTELERTFMQAHGLATTLRNAGLVAGPPHRIGDADRALVRTRFKFPERLPRGWEGKAVPLLLGSAAAAGAEPGLYGWADAHARQLAYERTAGRRSMHALEGAPMPVFEPMPLEELARMLPVIEASAAAAVPRLPQ